MNGHPAAVAQAPTTADKVAFLSRPGNYPDRAANIEVRETHMSWVFLGERLVHKLKKPVRYPFLDFSTVEARQRDCEREVRLNRRLAGGIYLGMVALHTTPEGGLTLDGHGEVVDWLVQMRRLPAPRMLDAAIAAERVSAADIGRVGRVMAAFYRDTAAAVAMTPQAYRRRFAEDIDANAKELAHAGLGMSPSRVAALATAQQRFVAEHGGLLEQRAREGRIVEGHGDLRPEHICLLAEPVIIDCLEFKRELRLLDPLDELAYLALECERLGAPAVGRGILERYGALSGDPCPAELTDFYRMFRAAVRARIALWHTDDDSVRDHDKWRARAREYIELGLGYGGRGG